MLIGLLSGVAMFVSMAGSLSVQASAVTSWDFNQYDGDARRIEATDGQSTLVLGDYWNESSLSSPAGSRLNAVESSTAGKALSLSGMVRNGKYFELFLPFQGGVEAKVSAVLRRSGTGFDTLRMSISFDGGKTFVDAAIWSIGETWAIHSSDLPISGSPSQLILRFEVDGASSSRGTLLLDNLQVQYQKQGTQEQQGSLG